MLPSEIVDIIEKILRDKGISKSDFYSSCGVSAAVFSNWRVNKNYPSMNNLVAINEFLGTNFGITQIEKTAPISEDGLNAIQRQLIQLLPLLDDADISVLLSTAQSLIASRRFRDSDK